MLLVGLTGGIGSGKSTVAAGLAVRGAAIIDVDGIGREVVEPGGPAYEPVIDRFGAGIVGEGGRLDRAALASVVFSDREALEDLNGITHPAIAQIMAERVGEAARDHDVVVLDIALLGIATADLFSLDAVIVVDAPEDVAVARLVEHRGFSEADARARVAAQISRDERRATADLVVDNSRDAGALEAEIDRAWAWLQDRLGAPA